MVDTDLKTVQLFLCQEGNGIKIDRHTNVGVAQKADASIRNVISDGTDQEKARLCDMLTGVSRDAWQVNNLLSLSGRPPEYDGNPHPLIHHYGLLEFYEGVYSSNN
jgi:hypothetical protein